MLLRPVDASGDILPVLSTSALVSDPESVVLLVRDRLNLLSGEWWENPSWGCEIFNMIRSGRVTVNADEVFTYTSAATVQVYQFKTSQAEIDMLKGN